MKKQKIFQSIITIILVLSVILAVPATQTLAAKKDLVKVTGISLDQTEVTMKAGDSLQLKETVVPEKADNKAVTWKSSNEEVATVSKTGKVQALSNGTAKITVKTKDGKFKASCRIRVLFRDLEKLSDDMTAPIYWAMDNHLTDGIVGDKFLPEQKCTTEDALLFLYNLKEKPEYKTGTTFENISKDSVYYDAISWAQESKLLKDVVKDNTFKTGKACTKEKFVTLLYRIAEEPYVGYDGRFGDADSDGYYKDAVNWASENSITSDYRNADGSPRYIFGVGDTVTREEALMMIYNYDQSTHITFAGYAPSDYAFPALLNGTEVPDELYKKYSDPKYCAEVFAYYALSKGWQYEAVVGALAFMWAEGLSAKGTFTYEGCWTVTGPSGEKYDKTLDNEKWHRWVHSESCREQMIALTSYYNDRHYATGLGYCGESNAWNYSGGRWVQTLNRCDLYLAAADMMGVAWQDINFQTDRALYTITSCSYDPDYRDPTTYKGDAREYCARVFATVGYTGFPVWYDNGQLNAHLKQVEVVRPLVDAVVNHTSLIEEDLAK